MRTATAVAVGGIALAAAMVPASAGGCASCHLSEAGYPHGEMPDLEMAVGDTVEIDEVWRHFIPEWCRDPGFMSTDGRFSTGPHEADSSDSAAVAVSVSYRGSPVDGRDVLTIAALGVADSVRVRVWSTMGGQSKARHGPGAHEFQVRVAPRR